MPLINGENIKNVVIPKRIENFSTKFGIDEPVFVLYDNKIQEGVVRRIDCTFQKGISELETTILYTLELHCETIQFPEELCYKRKEELKDSL